MLIVLEGLDNCGKTTQAELIYDFLRKEGYNVHVSKELTTEIGRVIKRYFKNEAFEPVLKALLFAADREKRLEDVKVKLKRNEIVIMDRYIHSAIVYRRAEGLDHDWVRLVNKHVPAYDVGIYIDITPEESMKRYTSRKDNIKYSLDILRKIREYYLEYVNKEELICVNGMQDKKEITKEIINIIKNKGRLK